MNYTKEELEVDRGNSFDAIVYLKNKPHLRIASISTGVSVYSGATKEEGEGNLSLFLAAPSMYEALKAMYKSWVVRPDDAVNALIYKMAGQALAKAELKEVRK